MKVTLHFRRFRHIAYAGGALAGLCCALVSPAWSQANFAVETGLGYADNVARVPEGQETAETLGLVRLQADVTHDGPRLDAVVRSDLQYADYLRKKFEAEQLGGVDVIASYELLPQYITWAFSENYGQQVTDPFRAVGPGNRENISYLTTGPEITVPLGPRNFMQLARRYSDVRYEVSPLDNQRASEEILIGHNLRPARWLGLGYSKDKVDYENPGTAASDFDTEEGYLRLSSEASRSTLQIDLGQSRLNQPADKQTEPLFRANLTWRVTDARELDFQLGQRFADAGEAFRRLQGTSIDVGRGQDVLGTGAPFKNRYAGIGFDSTARSGSLRGALGWGTEDYVMAADQNRRIASVELDFYRRLSRFWSLLANARLDRREFVDIDRVDRDDFLQIGLVRVLGRRASVIWRVQQYRRRSSAVGSNVKDNMMLVSLRYSPRGTTLFGSPF